MAKRHTFATEIKFKVTLEAAKGTKTLSALAQDYQTRLHLLSAQIQPDGRVWLRYSVPGILTE